MSNPELPPEALHPATVDRVRATRLGISLDWLAVIVAIALAILARFDLLSWVKW